LIVWGECTCGLNCGLWPTLENETTKELVVRFFIKLSM